MKKMNLPPVMMIGIVVVLLTSCEKDDVDNGPQTYVGPSVSLGDGTASTFIVEDVNGDPVELGVRISESALNNLPDEMLAFVLELPGEAKTDFYTHVLLDWNPHGHEPPGLYDLPHFDVHFYIIPSAERMAIGPINTDLDLEKYANAPDEMYVPEDYFLTEGGVPQMGAHWLDSRAPELNGEVFTNTFLWGSYDGEFIFWEPMFTRDYLLSEPDDVMDIKQPAAYQKDGWYATKYRVSYSAMDKEYTVSLTDLEFHDATPMK